MRFNEVDIEVKHSGLLEVPAGKEVDQLPQSHFQKLIDKKGYEAVIRGLTNLEVWNKNKNPKLSQWASNMADKLKVANKKDESYSNRLFEANAKLINKLGKKTVSGLKKVGDFAKKGELLCTLHTNKDNVENIAEKVKKAFIFQDEPIKPDDTFEHGLIE